MVRKQNYIKTLILLGFSVPILWHFIFSYKIQPDLQRAGHDVGIAIVFFYGYLIAFIIMGSIEAIGTSLLGWTLLKNPGNRKIINILFLGISTVGLLSAIVIPISFMLIF